MVKKNILPIFVFLLIFFNFLLFSRVFSEKTGVLQVFFLDIGQGDSILIKTPTDRYVLIDGGDGASIIKKLSEVMPFGERTIDLVIATHPDKDHIAGLVFVFDLYDVKGFLYSGVEKDSDISETLLDKAQEEKTKIMIARRGMVFSLGAGAYLETLFPDRDVSGVESNTGSVVNRLVFGNESFLFTGDSPQSIEKYLVSLDGNTLDSKVLKLGHHGSKTSSSEEFLEMVYPEYGVLSYGENNRYGHPNQEVLDILNSMDIKRIDTGGTGTVVFSYLNQDLFYEKR